MKNKRIIERLKVKGTKFIIKGIFNYSNKPKIFSVDICCEGTDVEFFSVGTTNLIGDSMNVREFTPTSLNLYSYTMLGKQINDKVKYSNITFIEDIDTQE